MPFLGRDVNSEGGGRCARVGTLYFELETRRKKLFFFFFFLLLKATSYMVLIIRHTGTGKLQISKQISNPRGQEGGGGRLTRWEQGVF